MTTLRFSHLTLWTLAASALFIAGCGHHHNSPSTSYSFATTPAADYAQIDRVGMPGVNTAVITSKDAYNAATPADDATQLFVPQITTDVANVHTILDGALNAAGLVPATTTKSVTQAAPLILPDTLKINTTLAASFPNGRLLTDQVMDITLAVILLDLSQNGQTAGTLAALPLNPPANDKAFSATFPYLAAPF